MELARIAFLRDTSASPTKSVVTGTALGTSSVDRGKIRKIRNESPFANEFPPSLV